MDRSSLDVTEAALTAAKERGVEGDVKARVIRMARRSAICTHPLGNRRFEDYVLNVEGTRVTDVRLFDEADGPEVVFH